MIVKVSFFFYFSPCIHVYILINEYLFSFVDALSSLNHHYKPTEPDNRRISNYVPETISIQANEITTQSNNMLSKMMGNKMPTAKDMLAIMMEYFANHIKQTAKPVEPHNGHHNVNVRLYF